MALEKPQLRNLHVAKTKGQVITTLGAALGMALGYHFLISAPRKQRYIDFYRKYDAEKQLKILNESGEMQSYQV